MTYMKPHEAANQLFHLLDRLDAETTGEGLRAAEELCLVARKLDRLNVKACNGVVGPDGFAKWDEADQADSDKRRQLFASMHRL